MTLKLSVVSSETHPYWKYYSKLINPDYANILYSEVKDFLVQRQTYISSQNKYYPSKRLSCLFADQNLIHFKNGYYGGLQSLDWSLSPTLSKIKREIEAFTKEKFSYCLTHFYNPESSISWHRDSEALNPPTSVVSISLGATRKFRFRKIGQTRGWEFEYELQSGDVLWMLPGCQAHYEHTVPVQKRVKDWRINLTFRQ